MHCVISICNLNSDCSSKDITFHPFPTKPSNRAVWLKALRMEPTQLTEDSAVCSKHFMKGDVYVNKSGTCKLRAGAMPVINLQNVPISSTADARVCRICFTTDCRLYNMTEYNNLDQAYTILTGLSLQNDDNIPQYLCTECAYRLLNCVRFRSRSLRAHLILMEVVKKYEDITLERIKSVIGNDGPLGTQLTVGQTNHHNIVIHVKDENEVTKDRVDIEQKLVDVKLETVDESTAIDRSGYLPVLHEHYDIKMDTDDYINQNFNGNNSDMCSPNVNNDGTVKDPPEKDKEDVSVSMVNEGVTVSNDGVVKETVESDEDANILLMVKKTKVKRAKKMEQGPSKSKTKKYLSHQNYRLLADQLIIKPGTARAKVQTEQLCPTNIVKLRKRIAAYKPNRKMLYDKLPYQTVSDVPLWGRLKSDISIKPFSCRVCDFKTGYKKELTLHEKTHCDLHPITHTDWGGQSGGKTISCDVCNQVFLNKTHLYKHMEVSSRGKPYRCEICKEEFKFSSELDIHNRIHTGVKPYSCDTCKKSFNFETSLDLHTRRIHPNKELKKIKPNIVIKEEQS